MPSEHFTGGVRYTADEAKVHRQPPPKQLDKTPENIQQVLIESNALRFDLTLILGDGVPTPGGGLGGYEPVARPDDVSLTEWSGVDNWSLALPITIDDWATDDSFDRSDVKAPRDYYRNWEKVKRKQRRKVRKRWTVPEVENVNDVVETLIDLGLPTEGLTDPPPFRVYGKGVPPHLNGTAWVLADIDWGDRLTHPSTGNTKRQSLVLQLLAYTREDDYKVSRRKKNKKKGHERKRYTVKKGDTLQKIAAKVYGSPLRWKQIADANDIKNPRKLKVGDVLKIP